MRARITIDSVGYVTLEHDDHTGERIKRTFFCPQSGGYVRESDAAHRYPQVCDGLAAQGSTLIASSREALPAVIRREYRRMRRADSRFS